MRFSSSPWTTTGGWGHQLRCLCPIQWSALLKILSPRLQNHHKSENFPKVLLKKHLYQLRILSHHMDSVLNQARGFPLPWKTLLVFVFTTHLPWNAQRKCFCRFSFHINVSSLADGAEAIYCNVINYTTDFIHEKLMKGETDSFVWSTHESTERNPTW